MLTLSNLFPYEIFTKLWDIQIDKFAAVWATRGDVIFGVKWIAGLKDTKTGKKVAIFENGLKGKVNI